MSPSQPAKSNRKAWQKRRPPRQHTTAGRRAMLGVAIFAAVTVTILVAVRLLPSRSSEPAPVGQQDAPPTADAAQRSPGPDRHLRATGEVPTSSRPWDELDDPTSDGWDTEVFHSRAKKQLKAVGKLLAHPEQLDAAQVSDLVTDDFSCGSLRPANTQTVMADDVLRIERGSTDRAAQDSAENRPHQAREHQGKEGFVEAIRAAVAPFAGATDVRFQFKLFRVQTLPSEITTRQYFAISGRTGTGMVEQNAT